MGFNADDVEKMLSLPRPDEVQALITSNLEYILPLEDGYSPQAPEGMVDVNLPNIRRLFEHDVGRLDFATATERDMRKVVTEAALFGLAEIATDTPVDTGRAKGSWTVVLPDGSRTDAVAKGHAPPANSEQSAKLRKAARARVARRRKRAGG